MAYRDELTEIGARVYGRSTNTETGQLGARIYDRCDETESAQLGGRVYGHNDELDALGHRVYNPTHGEVVSYQQDDPADEGESRPWRLNESRPGPGAHYLDEAGQEADLDAIGARIARGGSGVEGIKTADNRDENYDVTGTRGLPGFDY
ncbi:hypothetical protein QP904_06185 [Corynebacterium kefirresidentii]|uniref:hypothetical protein n=1 Tax=Corynebacterium sp. MSK185 TaxID=3377092 RepID=UPI00254B3698|nr:hypothetical protein [Corynebacterium kefirresidentii]MDK8586061.1 hypothetical protein [Corynebacterium kefirresidentii]